jgi:hypothetical protein
MSEDFVKENQIEKEIDLADAEEKLNRKMKKTVWNAINEFNMIENGDRIHGMPFWRKRQLYYAGYSHANSKGICL